MFKFDLGTKISSNTANCLFETWVNTVHLQQLRSSSSSMICWLFPPLGFASLAALHCPIKLFKIEFVSVTLLKRAKYSSLHVFQVNLQIYDYFTVVMCLNLNLNNYQGTTLCYQRCSDWVGLVFKNSSLLKINVRIYSGGTSQPVFRITWQKSKQDIVI